MVNIFVICSVRGASEDYRAGLEKYVRGLELAGHNVHLPHRDTDQTKTGLEICEQNRLAIENAHEVHVFYNPGSEGTHFDLGMAFMCWHKLVVVENVEYGEGKSYPRMIDEWADSSLYP